MQLILSVIMWGLLLWLVIEIRMISLRHLSWLQLQSTDHSALKAHRVRRYFLFEPSKHHATWTRQLMFCCMGLTVVGLGGTIVATWVTHAFFGYLIGLLIFFIGYASWLRQYQRLLTAAVTYWQKHDPVSFTLQLSATTLPELRRQFNKLKILGVLLLIAMIALVLAP